MATQQLFTASFAKPRVSLADLQDATFNSGKVEFVLDAKVDQIRGRYSRPCSSLVGELLTIGSSWGPSVSPISGKRGIRTSLNWRSSIHLRGENNQSQELSIVDVSQLKR